MIQFGWVTCDTSDCKSCIFFQVEKLSKVQMQTHLCSTFSLDERAVETLYRFMEIEAPFNQVSSKLRVITRTKGKVRLIL